MARKTLLTESELRQFMKLACLHPIGQSRLDEFGYNPLDEVHPDEEGLADYATGDLERGHPGEAAADEEEAGLEMDLGDEEDLGPEDDLGAEGDMISVDDFMSALESALEDVLGEPVSTEMDDEGDEEIEDVQVDMEAGPDSMEVTASSEEEEMGPPPVAGNRPSMYEGATQDEIVNEVARRVAARLAGVQQKEKMVDTLAERILKRLTK